MGDALSPQTLSNLIGSIYDCVLEPDRWDKVLVDVGDALDCHIANVQLNDLRQHRFLINRNFGLDTHWADEWERHCVEIHSALDKIIPLLPSFDEPVVLARHVPREFLEATAYFREWLMPLGIVDQLYYVLMQSSARRAAFGLSKHMQHGMMTDREIEIGGLLLPHIRRAVTISNVLDAATIERERIADALDALRCAVMLTDARGTILHANRSAEEMLRDGGPVYGRGGMLHARTATAAEELRAAVRLAAQDETAIGKSGLSVQLTDSGAPPLFAHVLPLTGGDLRTRLQPAAVAAVFIGAPPDTHDGAELMAVAYGLTPAETRVLASLLAGRTLAETATALGIAGSTANTHLDNIFSKSGVSRQADLIRLGAQMVPPIQATA